MLINGNKFSQNQENFLMLKRINLLLYSLCFKNIIGVHSILLFVFKDLRIISKPRMAYLEVLALKLANI